jgi:hypothetical protein
MQCGIQWGCFVCLLCGSRLGVIWESSGKWRAQNIVVFIAFLDIDGFLCEDVL